MVTNTEKTNVVITGQNRAGPAFRAAKREATSFGQALTGLRFGAVGAGVAIGGMVAGLAVMTSRAVENAEQIGKVADAVGLTTDELQEYRFAAELSGVETKAFDKSMEQFVKRMGEASAGTGALVTFLKAYDQDLLSALESTNSQAEALDVLFAGLEKINSETDRAALLTAAFGRSGVRLNNILREGTAGIEAMRDRARDLGVVFDESLIRQAEVAADRLFEVEQVLSVNFQKVLLQATPTIIAMGEAFGRAAPHIRQFADNVSQMIFGLEGLSLQGLRDQLVQFQEDLEVAEERERRRRLGQGKFVGSDEREIQVIQAKIAEVERLIEARAAEAKARAITVQLGQQGDEEDEGFTQAQIDRSKRLQDRIRADLLATAGLEEELLMLKRERRIAEIDQAALTEEERRIAEFQAELQHELALQQLRRDMAAQRQQEHAQEQDVLTQQTSFGAKRNLQLWKSGLQGQLAVTGSILESTSALMESKNKTMFKIGKAAAIASAIINTFLAANRAYAALAEIPIVGPALGAAAAAAAVAAGLINVNKIRQQKFEGGGSSGGGGGGGSISASGGSVPTAGGVPNVPNLEQLATQTPRQLNITVKADSEQVDLTWVTDNLIPRINEALNDGTTLVGQTT